MQGPSVRFTAVVYSLLVEQIDSMIFDEDAQKAARAILEWPDVTQAREEEEADRAGRAALATLGINLDIEGAWAEHVAQQMAQAQTDDLS